MMKTGSFLFRARRAMGLGAVLAATLFGGANAANAVVTTYTNATAFLGALQSPAYIEGFNTHSGDFVQGPQNFSLGPIGFTLTDIGSGYTFYSTGGAGQGSVFPTGLSYTDSFRITFIGNITAVGGTFFLSTPSFIPESGGTVTATLATGETLTLASTDSYNTEPFGGFVSSAPITSLTLTGTHLINGQGAYLSLDNLIVSGTAAAVPEPATWALLAGGGAALALFTVRRRQMGAAR